MALFSAAFCATVVVVVLAERGVVRVPCGTVALVGGVVCVALASSGMELARELAFQEAMRGSSPSSWSIEVTGDPVEGDYGFRCRAVARREGSPSAGIWLTSSERIPRGSTIRCIGHYQESRDDEWGRSSRMQAVWGTVRVVRVLSTKPAPAPVSWLVGLRDAACERLVGDGSSGGALLSGCVCGSRDAMRSLGLDELFATCGVSHLAAVSGTHIAVVSVLVARVLQALPLGPVARAVAMLLTGGAYVVMCGAPASAVRAWAMSCVAFGSGLVGRRSHALSSVSVVALAMALARPGLSGELGFVLSILSVCGICLFTRYAAYVLGELLPAEHLVARMPRGARRALGNAVKALGDGVAATLAAQFATLPVSVATFGSVSLVAPLANMIAGPLMPLLIALGVLGALPCPAPALQAPILWAGRLLGDALVACLRIIARLPFSLVTVEVPGWACWAVVTCCAVGLLVWWPRMRRGTVTAVASGVVAVLCVLLVRWRWFAPARVCVLDVGQGDAILVQDGGFAVLVDTGPGDAVAAALARNHVLHLDAIVITHLHDDHYGGMGAIAQGLGCDAVVVAQGVGKNADVLLADELRAAGAPLVEVSHGQDIGCGRFSMRVVSPVEEVEGDQNADSMELLLTFDDGGRVLTALLTGDAEAEETGSCIRRGEVGDIDLLKVGHHGSAVSVDDASARVLLPEVSVASAGEGNSYGHPTQECRGVLEGVGSLFLCTIDCGDVEVRPGSNGPVVCRQRGV